ncbi:2-oxoglutarate dehydrogenase E1 component [Paenibacillus sp. 1_12]|uniref:2-oxoglutarate dehydrogenase E1 component n=1 Tax=Paenibacillus sp. 1_12 TaxID=1566278 RepID=UPI0008F08EA7|nr:2-oxoglutarate dehydrogenase E1 component [Paenibacillus sp. 1_12]SFL93174.1 2-oxoglutarate dehydrogenase E1 component [Paenibacillus sp. 1_12]
MTPGETKRGPWEAYFGPNLGYLYEQYDQYVIDPDSVEPTFRELFDLFGAPPAEPVFHAGQESADVSAGAPTQSRASQEDQLTLMKKVVAADRLVWNIRTYGHLAADTDPLGLRAPSDTRILESATYDLTEADLKEISASLIWENAQGAVVSGWDAIQRLREIYTKTIAYEFSHVHEQEEREWLNKQVESNTWPSPLAPEERKSLLKRLIQVEQFEHFLQRTFVGQKRFSIEGLDVLVPVVDEIVNRFTKDGASHILMGMAHRGRLNVLTHVLGKPYSKIFSEFHHSPNKDLIPSEGSVGINYGWTGDVKYHLGAYRSVTDGEKGETRLMLANNPSHLEYVNPVVEGFTRAAQDDRTHSGFPKQDVSKAVTVLIHGDAAFPGEGVVAETLNFNNLSGYSNGGTIHIIANNRLGFTTESSDSRSTHYASDLAKGFEMPIVHVNADDPEACVAAIRLASEYRIRFKKDFLIDLVGYRRYGHNETDDPEATQPIMYNKVHKHPTVSEIYASKLNNEGVVEQEQAAKMKQDALKVMQDAYDQVKSNEGNGKENQFSEHLGDVVNPLTLPTAVPLEQLQAINKELLNFPADFQVYPKLQRILERRANALDADGKVDWALAETLAFATILAEGKPIRLSGQDSQRGTFAHRHLVLHNPVTGSTYSPLHQIPQSKASFAVHNSPLSEASVLGFEYGYNVFSPETLVIWEAQYGDFANAGQVIFDQFISAGRMKWAQKSSLIVMLPHGSEGQGPEHSSARLERFLQNAAEDNWTVANLTSAAQYFHLLRRQAAITESEYARPLILMAPKSLIRNQRVASPGVAFSEGSFQSVLEQTGLGKKPDQVKRLILCSGKVAIDLEDAIADQKDLEWLHVARVEQLYPFPKAELSAIIERFSNLEEIIWLQEENKNMGAWTYMEPRVRELLPEGTRLRHVGRPDRASTASGYQNVHSFEQQRIIAEALKPNEINKEMQAALSK